MKTKNIANRNEAQKKYVAKKKEAIELSKKIQRAIVDMPATGNWGNVGELGYLVSQLQEISDRLHGEGEYKE